MYKIKQMGWWCSLCNREYADEDVVHSKRIGGCPECPDCYIPMIRITRKHGDTWMSRS